MTSSSHDSRDDGDTEDLGSATAAAVRLLRLSHLTIEHAVDAVLWVDQTGRIRRANDAAVRMLGYPRSELFTRSVHELAAGSASAASETDGGAATWPAFLRSEATCQVELLLRTAHGEAIEVDVALAALEVEGEALNCAFVRDIRKRKQRERALRESLAEIEALKQRLQAENVYLREEVRREREQGTILGESAALRAVLKKVSQVAPTDATVLVLGESGTGKELVARALHEQSARRENALVRVNCAALPASLIESELFGHEKGAFTGAASRRLGRFELADGGTLFLDEVGDLPLELQAKLLRVLQEGELERLGDTRTLKVDVRVVAATNHDLEQAVAAGRFRADLYYRLNVFPLTLPPLRERPEDIPLLATAFAARFASKLGKPTPTIAPAMLKRLEAYAWPGNVRELQNVIERAVIVAEGPVLDLMDPAFVAKPLASASAPMPLGGAAPAATAPAPGPTLREVELHLMREALDASGWVVGGKRGAAARLGIPASTLRERMVRYGLQKG